MSKRNRARRKALQKACNHLSSAAVRMMEGEAPSELVAKIQDLRDRVEAYAVLENKKAWKKNHKL